MEALLSDRRVELADLRMVTRCVADLRSLLEESTLTERKSFISSFVKEVKVTGDEVLLVYTMPLPPEGISEEKVGVLYSVQSSGAGGIRTPYLLTASYSSLKASLSGRQPCLLSFLINLVSALKLASIY